MLWRKYCRQALYRPSILAEVIASLVNKGVSAADAEAALLTLDCKSEPFRREEALLAGRLRESTRQAGLSLGDRACLALALSLGLPVLTAERAWAEPAARSRGPADPLVRQAGLT